ncbi:MAG: hypothetical protein NTV79_07375 [Candidatus Aureabacteria bacterium]|nr:hypothetical protein [Candidatus Auribacterota bacterium]
MRTGWAVALLALAVCAGGCSPSSPPSPRGGAPSPTRAPFRPRATPPIPLPPASPIPLPTVPGTLSLGITAWNIEGFDGAGDEDTTFPTRSDEDLKAMAKILLDTRPAVIGLEEINSFSEYTETPPFSRILAALNQAQQERGGGGTWKGFVGQIGGSEPRVALAWDEAIVEPIAVRELSDLRVGYTSREEFPITQLRFPRIPLAGRFRLKKVPAFDFTAIVLHLKAFGAGMEEGLDENDIRRRGELEDLLFKWALKPSVQGDLRDSEIVIMGDLNDSSENLVLLLDEHGSSLESRGLLVLNPKELENPRAAFFFADGGLQVPAYYTYMGNAEKGEKSYSGILNRRDMVWPDRKNFIDHILLSRDLAGRFRGEVGPVYFDRWYPVSEHIHFSDHRPLAARISIPDDYIAPSR